MKYHYDELNRNPFESHMLAIDSIKSNTSILDIGCATGYFAKELAKKGCETYGVDKDRIALKKASKYCKEVIQCDLDNIKICHAPKKHFDYVLMLDVLEHLQNPKLAISQVGKFLKKDGRLVVSVPNIAHASIRWGLLKGDFDYTNTGILDSTHVHFYTLKSISRLLEKEGFRILKIKPTNGMCKVPFLYKITDRLPATWQYKLVQKFPNLFAYQFIIISRPIKPLK